MIDENKLRRGMNRKGELNMVFDDNFFEKCKTCQHCYTKQNDDETVYCRKRNGICKYKKYPRNNEMSQGDGREMQK